MTVSDNLLKVKNTLQKNITLVPVSKRKSTEMILEAYNAGQRIFGENKVQELTKKYEALPKDIQWHFIGHLQSNKVKYIAPFISLVHAVDSLKLLKEINKRAKQNDRTINCLLQIYIAQEESKFGLSFDEAVELLNSEAYKKMENVKIVGLMGMATNTENITKVKSEFTMLKNYFDKIKQDFFANEHYFKEISMGMSGDYQIAIEAGSTMIRVGSLIFGKRN